MNAQAIEAVRFRGDTELLEAARGDADLAGPLASSKALRRRNALRCRLLSHSVRVSVGLMPHLADSFQRLTERFELSGGLEAYVHNDGAVNAFVAKGVSRTIVVLSSGAVNLLTPAELEFVIGHELGHAVYGHLEVPVDHLLKEERFSPRLSMTLRAWQRAAEISADRAGLVSCESLGVAANALFKSQSGLELPGGGVQPGDFAAQWEQLVDEVLTEGQRDHWQLSHPFPTLRMKAMILFWDGRDQPGEVDEEVARLLALMDPMEGSVDGIEDPLLARFFFWGGLFIALADGRLDAAEVERLQSVAPSGLDVGRLTSTPEFEPDSCLERFRAAKEERRAKLTAVELHRIMQGLIDVAAADGQIDDQETGHLYKLAEVLGISPGACDLLVSNYLEQN